MPTDEMQNKPQATAIIGELISLVQTQKKRKTLVFIIK